MTKAKSKTSTTTPTKVKATAKGTAKAKAEAAVATPDAEVQALDVPDGQRTPIADDGADTDDGPFDSPIADAIAAGAVDEPDTTPVPVPVPVPVPEPVAQADGDGGSGSGSGETSGSIPFPAGVQTWMGKHYLVLDLSGADVEALAAAMAYAKRVRVSDPKTFYAIAEVTPMNAGRT